MFLHLIVCFSRSSQVCNTNYGIINSILVRNNWSLDSKMEFRNVCSKFRSAIIHFRAPFIILCRVFFGLQSNWQKWIARVKRVKNKRSTFRKGDFRLLKDHRRNCAHFRTHPISKMNLPLAPFVRVASKNYSTCSRTALYAWFSGKLFRGLSFAERGNSSTCLPWVSSFFLISDNTTIFQRKNPSPEHEKDPPPPPFLSLGRGRNMAVSSQARQAGREGKEEEKHCFVLLAISLFCLLYNFSHSSGKDSSPLSLWVVKIPWLDALPDCAIVPFQ